MIKYAYIKNSLASKRSHSEQDLLNMAIAPDSNTKISLKNRILTSIPGFGGSNGGSNGNHLHPQQHQNESIEYDK